MKKKVSEDNNNQPVLSWARHDMFGRTVIYSSVDTIDSSNIIKIMQKAMDIHRTNSEQADYLWNYRNGKQPVLARTKKVRPDICARIVENRASEITDFKIGFYVGEPIQYTSRIDTSDHLDAMEKLNSYMYAIGKNSQDQSIVEWQMVAGTAYRMVLPANKNVLFVEDRPFDLYTLDPRYTFVVYSTKLGNKPLMGCTYFTDDEKRKHFTVYTDKMCYKLEEYKLVSAEAHSLGMIPIFEYPANNSRLGCFEPALPLLDELNDLASNRMDGIESLVQSYIKFINCNIDDEKYEKFLSKGAIVVNSTENGNADVDVVTVELNQDQAQTMKQDIYNAILDICGVPSRTANASGDSTGQAIILRNGWETAEARARIFENVFKESEKNMLTLVLKICKESGDMPLMPWEIETKFTRRNYEAIVSKANVLTQMLDNPKIHPLLAYEHCGMFTDPEGAWMLSKGYYEENEAKYSEPVVVDEGDNNSEKSVRADGQIIRTAKEDNIA